MKSIKINVLLRVLQARLVIEIKEIRVLVLIFQLGIQGLQLREKT